MMIKYNFIATIKMALASNSLTTFIYSSTSYDYY